MGKSELKQSNYFSFLHGKERIKKGNYFFLLREGQLKGKQLFLSFMGGANKGKLSLFFLHGEER